MPVVVRFAPSPTGLLHVGALRTVLFDDLLRRKEGGRSILRIEDTDRTRYNEGSEAEFVATLAWVGIEFDEGPHVGGPSAPYRQSERKAAGVYDEHIGVLLAKGDAYRAFETGAELDEMREFQRINKSPIGYFGGDWRDADPAIGAARAEAGDPFVIRMKVPRGRLIEVQDAIRGRVPFESDTLPDPVLIKADGMPTYHFAAMVDDRLMGVTHVLRGEEWIPTSPYHWLLFEMFGWTPPVFVHCPVIVGTDGKKLSKRHGATRVLDYMAQGYVPSALRNFVALIGWSPGGDLEIMDDAELVARFAIEGIQPSPGRFDLDKLRWLNGHRIRSMGTEALLGAIEALAREPYFREYWTRAPLEDETKEEIEGRARTIAAFDRLLEAARGDREYALKAIALEQERVQTLVDFGGAADFFWHPEMDAKAFDKWLAAPHARALLNLLRTALHATENSVAGWEALLRSLQVELGLEKFGPVVHPVRVALTGRTNGPGLFELMEVLGPDRMAKRIDHALTLMPS